MGLASKRLHSVGSLVVYSVSGSDWLFNAVCLLYSCAAVFRYG